MNLQIDTMETATQSPIQLTQQQFRAWFILHGIQFKDELNEEEAIIYLGVTKRYFQDHVLRTLRPCRNESQKNRFYLKSDLSKWKRGEL